jgi:hypothetical protein
MLVEALQREEGVLSLQRIKLMLLLQQQAQQKQPRPMILMQQKPQRLLRQQWLEQIKMLVIIEAL